MDIATVAPFAQGYAHPVDTARTRRTLPYGPHDPAGSPTTVKLKCGGRYPLCSGEDHPAMGYHDAVLPVHPTLLRLREQLNTLAYVATNPDRMEDTMADAYLSGFCNPSNPDWSHERCAGTWMDKPCSCTRDTCPCNKRRLLQQGINTATANLQQVQQVGALPQTVAVVTDDAVHFTPRTTGWRADEVADLMVELEECPLCSSGWDAHTFTDDDRVVCA